MSFSDIIAKVKAHPELWQTSHPFYRHRVVSARTWKEIAVELKTDEIILRKRWKHLKDQYRKEHKKVLAKTIPMSFWQRYNELFFLSDQSASTCNNEESTGDKRLSYCGENSNSESDDAPLTKRLKKIKTEPNHAPSTVRKPASVKTLGTRGIQSLITKSTDSGKLNLILNRLSAMEEVIETNNQCKDPTRTDTDYMFLLSLLPIMKKLTEIQKLQFRGKMNDWLLEIVTHNEFTERFD